MDGWTPGSDQFGDALDPLGFDVFIHSTGRNIDDGTIGCAYDWKEIDPDVADIATLRDLVEIYRTTLRDEFETVGRDTSLCEYNILVSVGERDVQQTPNKLPGYCHE